jgi:HSP20 family protein
LAVLARRRAARRRRPAPSGRGRRPYGSDLFLGDNLDAERLNASYDLGVLTLTIPVAEQAKPRRVQIAAQPSQPQPVGTSTSGARL